MDENEKPKVYEWVRTNKELLEEVEKAKSQEELDKIIERFARIYIAKKGNEFDPLKWAQAAKLAIDEIRRAKTPLELYNSFGDRDNPERCIKLSELIRRTVLEGRDDFERISTLVLMLNREARLAACKICDEYPTVEFPKVPSGTDTQSVLDWCIEAEQCFQKSKRDGFKNISGKKALEILPAHHPFSPRYDVSLGYTFDQTRFLQSRNIHDAIKIVKKLAMYWTSLEVKYPKEAMQLLRCVRSGLSTYRAKNRNIPPIPNDWLGIQDWIIDANKCLHKASKTIETKKNKNEDLTDTEQNSGEAGKTKNKPDTQNIAVDDKELTILIELNAGDNKTFSQVEIGASTSIKRGTIKDKLPRLEKIGLIYRPLGKRKGYQITDKGREIAKRHQ